MKFYVKMNQKLFQSSFKDIEIKEINNQYLPQKLKMKKNQPQLNELNISQSQGKCSQSNKAIQFCFNSKCQQKEHLTCFQSQCVCNQQHLKCQKGNIRFALNVIKQKAYSTQQVKNQMNSIIDKAIDQLSCLKQSLQILFQDKLQFIQLSQVQINFQQLLQGKIQSQKINSQNLSQLWQNINQEKQSKNKTLLSIVGNELNNFQERNKLNIGKTKKDIENIVLEYKNRSHPKQLQSVLKNSSIIKQQEQLSNLSNFFNSKIKSFQLIFKASENNFKLSKYFQKFGSMTHPLVICLTNKDKIIGGYTPLELLSADKSGYAPDPSNSSFVFSLTTNQKFPLVQNRDAILRDTSGSINFGGGKFDVCDNANTVNGSRFNMGSSNYQNLHYKQEKQSFMKITGSETNNYMTKQWEVWKVNLY